MAENSLCTVTMLKASLSETLEFVSYYRDFGVDHMYLYFDDPDDAAIEALGDDEFVTCIRCDEAYWARCSMVRSSLTLEQAQWRNLDNALNGARRDGFQWLLHIDCDERLYSRRPIHELLDEAGTDVEVVRFPTLEAVPEALHYDHPYEQIHLFRIGPCRPTRRDFPRGLWNACRVSAGVAGYYLRYSCAFLLGCKTLYQGQYLRGHIGGKAAVRVNAEYGGMGVHLPRPVQGRRVNSVFNQDGALLHFDSVDYARWRSKWQARSQESIVPKSRKKQRKQQVQEFAKVFKTGDEEKLQALFKRQYFLSGYEKTVLGMLGLLADVKLSPPSGSGSAGHRTDAGAGAGHRSRVAEAP